MTALATTLLMLAIIAASVLGFTFHRSMVWAIGFSAGLAGLAVVASASPMI